MNAAEREAVRDELRLAACGGRLNEAVWGLFYRYQNTKIIEKKILFFSLNLYVRDLRKFVVMIFGEPDLNQ